MKSKVGLVLVAALVISAYPLAVAAQTYPSRPVRMVVPFGPGGTVDVFTRIAAEKLTARMGQSFYAENVAGASGNIATSQVARSAPDGHTLLMAFSTYTINPSLMASVPYDPMKDFEPVTLAVSGTHVISVNPSVPAKSLKELVALVKANPGKYSFAHGGVGTPGHLLGEQFRLAHVPDLVPVPFNGAGPAIASVIGGHTPVSFSTLASAYSQIGGGQLRALAVTSKARSAQLPDVPTTTEAGFAEIVGDIWVGVMVPARTPKEIIARLQKEFTEVIGQAETRERLAKVGFDPVASTSEAFGKQIATELVSWRNVIQAARLKAP
jgi:tripartite-type tricarboxylate transporter receptor subunit TctC